VRRYSIGTRLSPLARLLLPVLLLAWLASVVSSCQPREGEPLSHPLPAHPRLLLHPQTLLLLHCLMLQRPDQARDTVSDPGIQVASQVQLSPICASRFL